MTYIDMNMIRAGVVDHPLEWEWSGYTEIQYPPRRYGHINRDLLRQLLELSSGEDVAAWQKRSLAQALLGTHAAGRTRCAEWSESIAVGSETYLANVRRQLGINCRHRTIEAADEDEDAYMLYEEPNAYRRNNGVKNSTLSTQNTHSWRLTYS